MKGIAKNNDYFMKALKLKNKLQDYAGAWRAVGCSCNNCSTCDDRHISPQEAEEMADFIDLLTLHCGALKNQLNLMIEPVEACREFAQGFHGMSRNNAENLADELLEKINACHPFSKERDND